MPTCCKVVSTEAPVGVADDPFSQMVVLDYYDGPAGGFLKCGACNKEYLFYLLEWDKTQTVRIFALAPVQQCSMEKIYQLFMARPNSRVWIPPWPSQDDQLDVLERELQMLTDQATEATTVIAWSVRGEKTLAMRGVDPSVRQHLRPRFELASDAEVFDWFGYLALTNQHQTNVDEGILALPETNKK